MTDRETLEAVSKGYHELIANYMTQRNLIAQMMRGCIRQLSSPNAKTRCEAIKAMGDLADLLETKNE